MPLRTVAWSQVMIKIVDLITFILTVIYSPAGER